MKTWAGHADPRELLRLAPSPNPGSYCRLDLLFQAGPAWTRDGKYITYPNGEGGPVSHPGSGWTTGGDRASKGRGGYDNLSLSPDGRRLLFTRWDHRAEIWTARNLLPEPKALR